MSTVRSPRPRTAQDRSLRRLRQLEIEVEAIADEFTKDGSDRMGARWKQYLNALQWARQLLGGSEE